MGKTARERLYEQMVRKQRIGMLFARALAKRRRGLFDRILVVIAMRMAGKAASGEDFMRDPLIDAEPEFSIDELRRFREGHQR